MQVKPEDRHMRFATALRPELKWGKILPGRGSRGDTGSVLILPLHKKLSRDNFPAITLLLILINVLVFFGLQGGDGDIQMEAAQYYQDSSLEQREWEWLDEYVPAQDRDFREQMDQADRFAQEGYDELLVALNRAHIVSSHPEFLDDLRAGEIVARDSEIFRDWKSDRERYEGLLAESFTERYQLRFDEINPVTSLSHMFMHGGLDHLLGNMLFLLLLGLLVEGALGRGLFLASYLAAGLGAVVASLAVHWGGPSGGLGASGAIAGLMGLYAVLYGKRRVRFFYWVWVYFDYVRAPAIILLPAWLGWELLQFFMAGGANIAYEAHIGGMVTGALLAIGIQQLGWQRDEFLDEESQQDEDREALAAAEADLAALRVPQAKQKLRPLLERHPHDLGVLKSWYNACKLQAEDPDLHDAAQRIFALPGQKEAERELLIKTFADYRRRGKQRMNARQMIPLASRLIRWGAPEEGKLLLDRLLALQKPPKELAPICLALARQMIAKGQKTEAGSYLDQAERLSQEPAVRQAVQQLRK